MIRCTTPPLRYTTARLVNGKRSIVRRGTGKSVLNQYIARSNNVTNKGSGRVPPNMPRSYFISITENTTIMLTVLGQLNINGLNFTALNLRNGSLPSRIRRSLHKGRRLTVLRNPDRARLRRRLRMTPDVVTTPLKGRSRTTEMKTNGKDLRWPRRKITVRAITIGRRSPCRNKIGTITLGFRRLTGKRAISNPKGHRKRRAVTTRTRLGVYTNL